MNKAEAKTSEASQRTREKYGFTVFLTGLPGSGKTTIARVLSAKLVAIDSRPVTMIDGDELRKTCSRNLGFSKKDREINVRRAGAVAKEITKNGGIAICSLIAPFEASRRANREMISRYGGYVEVYVSTPVHICEARDKKGLYAKARMGLIQNFTGISHPYEEPRNPEVIVDTTYMTPEEAVEKIIEYLKNRSYVSEKRGSDFTEC